MISKRKRPTLGNWMTGFRIAEGKTIGQVARETDLSRSHIADIENGTRRPSIVTLDRLVEYYGLSKQTRKDLQDLRAKELIEAHRNRMKKAIRTIRKK